MGGLFLNPWLFAGLLALAVPIFVHLARLEQDEDRPFPSLMFIKRIKVEDRRRRTLRDRMLLLARLLVPALVVLAFVRPYLANDAGQTAGSAKLSQTIFALDVSASMAMPGQFDQATQALRSAIEALPESASAAVVVFDTDARQIHEMSDDHASLLQSVDDIDSTAGTGSTRYAPAFSYANELLKSDSTRISRVVLISDLQASGFDESGVALLENVELEVIAVQQEIAANLMIGDVRAEDENLEINVINTGRQASEATSITLAIDNVEQQIDVQGLEPGASAVLTVPFSIKSSAAVSVQVMPGPATRTEDTGMPSDLNYAAVYRDGRTVNTLVVTNASYRRDVASTRRSYLAHALQLAEYTNVVEIQDRNLTADSFASFDVILFDDGVEPQGKVADALIDAIEQGVGVLMVNDPDLNDTGSRRLTEYLPGEWNDSPETNSTDTTGAFRIENFLDYHSLTATLRPSLEGDGALSAVTFLRYRKVTPGANDRVLAELDNGDPLMLEKVSDKGRVLVLTASLDNKSSNLATAPGFVQLSHRILDYLADRSSVTESYLRGSVVDLARHAGAFPGGGSWRTGLADVGAVIESPSGQQVRLDPGQAFYQPMEIGIHQARLSNANAGTIALAVNQDPRESNLERIDSAGFRQRTVSRPWPELQPDAAPTAAQTDSGQLWRWLLAIAGLLLVRKGGHCQAMNNITSFETLNRFLTRMRRRWRLRRCLEIFCVVVIVGLIGVLALIVAMNIAQFELERVATIRRGLWLLLLVCALLAIGMLASIRTSRQQLVRRIEQQNPSLDGLVLTGFDRLKAYESDNSDRATKVDSEGSSLALDQRLSEQATAALSTNRVSRTLDGPGAMRAVLMTLSAFVIFFAIVALGPEYLRHGTHLLSSPQSDPDAGNPYSVSVKPGDIRVLEGEDLRIHAQVEGFKPDRIQIFSRLDEQSPWVARKMDAVADSTGDYEAFVFDVDESQQYYVEADRFKTEIHSVEVIQRPEIEAMDVVYEYPEYTGRSADRVENANDLKAIKGSEATFEIETDQQVARGQIVLRDGTTIELKKRGENAAAESDSSDSDTLTATLPIETDDFYHIELEASDGRMISASPEYAIFAIEDELPDVEIKVPGRDSRVTSVEEVSFAITARDDVALNGVELVISVNGAEEETISLSPDAENSECHRYHRRHPATKPDAALSGRTRTGSRRPDRILRACTRQHAR